MKRVLRILALGLGVVVLLAGALALYVQLDGIPRYEVEKVDFQVEATPEAFARGKKLATLLCAGCHMDPYTLRLTGKHMRDVPPQFGTIFSKNLTRHPVKGIGAWSTSELAYVRELGSKPRP